MDFSAEEITDMVTLLQMIPIDGEGIGWYTLERILARRGHSISLDGKLMDLLKKLESNGFIELKSISESMHPVYIATSRGKKWLESQQIKKSENEN